MLKINIMGEEYSFQNGVEGVRLILNKYCNGELTYAMFTFLLEEIVSKTSMEYNFLDEICKMIMYLEKVHLERRKSLPLYKRVEEEARVLLPILNIIEKVNPFIKSSGSSSNSERGGQ